MFSTDALVRVMQAFWDKAADAPKNLAAYLDHYIKPDFVDKVDMRSIFVPLINRASGEIQGLDPNVFTEDLVDKAMEYKLGDNLQGGLMGYVQHRMKVTPEEAESIVTPHGEADKEIIQQAVKEFAPMVYSYVQKSLRMAAEEWIRAHAQEGTAPTEELPEVAVPPEHETEEAIKEEYSWEEGLIKNVLRLINERVPENKRPAYKLILKDMLLAEKPKTIPQVAKETGLAVGTIHGFRTDLAKLIAPVLQEQGPGKLYMEKLRKEKEEVESVPDYKTYLKDNPERQKSLWEYFKSSLNPQSSDMTKKVISELCTGKTPQTVSEESESSRVSVTSIKNRYFDPGYEKWYAEQQEKSSAIYSRLKQAIGENVELPKEDQPSTVHEKMLAKALSENRIVVTVYFWSEYDNTEVASGAKDPAKDPSNFKYSRYAVSLYEKRSFGKTSRSLEYLFSQMLNDDGTFIGQGKSTLKVDDTQVDENNSVKASLDKYVEEKLKPEGMLPHKFCAAEYVNRRDNKTYHGIASFASHFRGIGQPDSAHKERVKNWESLQLRKRTGPTQLPTSDLAKARALHTHLKLMLHEELSKKPALRDQARIEELKHQVQEAEDVMHGRAKDMEEVEDIIRLEKELADQPYVEEDKEAAFGDLPGQSILPPAGEKVKQLADMFTDLKLTGRPNPKLWLEPADLIVLAKTLKAAAEVRMEAKIKEMSKEKGLKTDEKEKRILSAKKEFTDLIDRAIELFKEVPADLKRRLDLMKPEDRDNLAKTKDTKWVDSSKAQESVDRAIRTLRFEALEKAQPKEKTIQMLEKQKFKGIEGYLKTELEGIGGLAYTLLKAPMARVNISPALEEKMLSSIKESKQNIEGLHTIIKELIASPQEEFAEEEQKAMQDASDNIVKLTGDLNSANATLKFYREIPAQMVGHFTRTKLDYFGKLYSYFSRILWFKEKQVEKFSADPERTVDEKVELSNARDRAVDELHLLSSHNIFEKKAVDSGVAKAKKAMKDFLEVLDAFFEKPVVPYSPVEPEKAPGEGEKLSIDRGLPYARVTSDLDSVLSDSVQADSAEDLDKARAKAIFPADEIHAAELLIHHLGMVKGGKKKNLQQMAKEELDRIVKNVTEAYREGFDKDRINYLAGKWNMSSEAAAVNLRKIKDALAKKAIGEFIFRWQELAESGGNKKKERSPLGNRPASEYDVMGNFVETHLPDLFKLSPPQDSDVPEQPQPAGIPTPKEIREQIEYEFGMAEQHLHRKKDKDEEGGGEQEDQEVFGPEDVYKMEDFYHGSGGGGGKSKGRSKPIKPPLPRATAEQLKDTVIHLIKTKPAKDVVLYVMAMYTKKVRDAIKSLKEDEYIDTGDVIDSLVSLLKNLYFQILKLNVQPSGQMKLPPAAPTHPGEPKKPSLTPDMFKSVALPDIPFDSYDELLDLFHKIVEIYQTINHYIEPDEVGVPPSSLSNAVKLKKYLPSGLMDWGQHMMEQEGRNTEIKDAAGFPIGFISAGRRVAGNFACSVVESLESTEPYDFDIISR